MKNKIKKQSGKSEASACVINDGYELVSIDLIRPHPSNPRQGDVAGIVESIEANGFYGACVVQRSTGYILVGNHRWKSARETGLQQVPVIWADVDDDRARRILLADNKTSDDATYDENALAGLLKEIQTTTGTLEGTGFDDAELDDLLSELGMLGDGKPEPAKFKPETIKAGTVADLAPTEEERAVLAGRKLLIAYSGGKDSSAAAVWARHYFPDNETELLFVDLGADFVGFHLYLHDAAEYLGVPLVILRSNLTVLDTMLTKGYDPAGSPSPASKRLRFGAIRAICRAVGLPRKPVVDEPQVQPHKSLGGKGRRMRRISDTRGVEPAVP